MLKFKLILKFLIALVVVSFFLLLKLLIPDSPFSEKDSDIVGGFIEWFGVIYGVLLALVVVEVWQKNTLINSEVDREADALVLLLKTARYIENRTRIRSLARNLKDYAEKVIQLQGDNCFGNSEISNHLDAIHHEAGKIVIDDKTPAPIASEIMRQVNDAIDTRGDWVAHAKEHILPALWVLIIVSSVSWVLCFFGLQIENFALAIAMSAVATFTVTAIILLIKDLDDSSCGLWRVHFDSFEVLKNEANTILSRGSKKSVIARKERHDYPPITVVSSGRSAMKDCKTSEEVA